MTLHFSTKVVVVTLAGNSNVRIELNYRMFRRAFLLAATACFIAVALGEREFSISDKIALLISLL